MRPISLLSSCVALTLFAGVADASQYDTTVLFQRGDWSVEHTYNTLEGNSWCAADTVNTAGQWFSVVAYDHGGAAIIVGDPRWRPSARAVRFRVDVDYSRWNINGAAKDEAVSVFLRGEADVSEFIGQLMEGVAVAVYSEEDRRLATFSLKGSRLAVQALFACWARIEGSDPFTRASDPF